MIPLFVFYIHTLACVVAFTRRWQEGGWGEGLLAVGFIALIFAVGWSISTFIVQMFMDEQGFGFWFNRDAASLTLLTIMEGVFYFLQWEKRKRRRTKSAL